MDKAELASIHAEFADPIIYTGAGLAAATITGTYIETAAPTFPGQGATARKISFEVQDADLPQRPGKGNRIEHETGDWRVIDATRDRSIDAWILIVEEAE